MSIRLSWADGWLTLQQELHPFPLLSSGSSPHVLRSCSEDNVRPWRDGLTGCQISRVRLTHGLARHPSPFRIPALQTGLVSAQPGGGAARVSVREEEQAPPALGKGCSARLSDRKTVSICQPDWALLPGLER